MQIKTAIVIRPLDLGEYDETLRGQTLQVWVNPPREVRAERAALINEFAAVIRQSVSTATAQLPAKKRRLALGFAWLKKPPKDSVTESRLAAFQKKTYAWLANILSQGDEPVAVEELEQLIDADEVLYEFILKRAVEMIEAFRAEKKSPLKMPLKLSNATK